MSFFPFSFIDIDDNEKTFIKKDCENIVVLLLPKIDNNDNKTSQETKNRAT